MRTERAAVALVRRCGSVAPPLSVIDRVVFDGLFFLHKKDAHNNGRQT